HLDLPINRKLIRSILPNARLIPRPTLKESIEDVCAQRADAVYVDEVTGVAALLNGLSCASQPLRVIPLPMLRITLGVGSPLALSAVADEIRNGMDDSVSKADSARTLTSWGYFSPRNMEYLNALVQRQQRERWPLATI